MNDFRGAKIALLKGDEVLVIQRDDKPGLPNAGLWDFPGGGREGTETPLECVAREVREELSIDLNQESVIWQKTYPAMDDPGATAYFMVAPIDDNIILSIVFGDEGQGWKMMKIVNFMSDPTVIEALKTRLKDFLASIT